MDKLPVLQAPPDLLRVGLGTLKEQAGVSHPVEALQKQHHKHEGLNKMKMMSNVYGSALPARMQIEEQILSRCHRLPGMPSSHLGLESLSGQLDEFAFESYVGLPEDSTLPEPDLHSQMEIKLKIRDTKPVLRGIL